MADRFYSNSVVMGSCFRRNDTDVIASEAKQSIFDLAMPSRGFLRFARNDGAAIWVVAV